jgi:hypothetical protein
MPPIDALAEFLQNEFPDAEIEVRKADGPNGFHFLNLFIGEFHVAVEHKDGQGFGVDSFDEKSHPLEGMFSAPEKHFATIELAFDEIHRLMTNRVEALPIKED